MRRVIIAKNQTIYRQVCLPVLGNVNVRAGETIGLDTVIAEVNLPERFEMIDIPNHFKIEPEQSIGMIKRLVGDVISRGDVLAQKEGFITQLFRSPADGKVVSLREGRITLALGMEKRQVFSPVPGMVTEIIPNRGAVIAVRGMVIEGSWANGAVAHGELAIWEDLDKNVLGIPNDTIEDKIVAFKSPISGGQLRRILRLKPLGLIFPTLVFEQYKLLRESEIAAMSLMGFGDAQMDSVSLAMLENMQGKEVYLLGEKAEDGREVKPFLVLPEESEPDLGLLHEDVSLKAGAKVRLRGKPYTGMVGIVKELPDEPATFASGLKSKMVSVEVADGEILNAAMDNLELIVE